MDNNIIKLEKVSKTFRVPHDRRDTLKQYFANFFRPSKFTELNALQDINLEIKRGEFVGIIGPNGSGKSTLLRVIAGIFQPNSGKVVINGTIAPFLELGIGFQPELSARDNIYLYGAILGLSRQTIKKKFDSIIRFAELEKFVDQKLKRFSSGMHVRLAFATAIQAEADVLLVDEVLAVGDFAFQQKCYEYFRNLKKHNKTVIYVSHSMESVREFCNKTYWLNNGIIEAQGESGEVIKKYMEQQSDFCINSNRGDFRDTDKDVRITSVKIFDNKKKERSTFNTNEEMRVEINYKAKKKVTNPIFQVQISRYDGVWCHVENTERHRIKLHEVEGDKTINLKYNNINLLRGKYYLIVKIWPDKYQGNPYDERGKVCPFLISSQSNQGGGMVFLDTEWLVN